MKLKPIGMWRGKATIEISNLRLSTTYDEIKRGSRLIRTLVPQGWLSEDGKSIMWDVGKRTKGWFVTQMKTLRPSAEGTIKHGLKCESLPNPGPVAIAKVSDMKPGPEFSNKDKIEYELCNEFKSVGWPEKEAFAVTQGRQTRALFAYYYTLKNPVSVSFNIYSMARNFSPDSAKEMLTKCGIIAGVGDGYAQGYGTFKLKDFEAKEEELAI